METRKIKVNKIRCKSCGDVIESEHTHDFRWCKCGSVAVDGGKSYLKRCGNIDNIEELSEYEGGIGVREFSKEECRLLVHACSWAIDRLKQDRNKGHEELVDKNIEKYRELKGLFVEKMNKGVITVKENI